MLAYQFQTTVEDGLIRIPSEYKAKIGTKIKVSVINDEDIDWDECFPPVVDTSSWKFDREEANAR